MKTMQKVEQQADIPIKERNDGTVLAALNEKDDPFLDHEDDTSSDSPEHNDGVNEDDDQDNENGNETDEEREAIREARREERKLKKELTKQREVSAKHKISALERRNEDLARRLAQVENAAVGFQFAQVDRLIEDEATRVEYAKMKMTQAAQAGDMSSQVEYMDQYHDAKNKLAQAQMFKKQQLEDA